MRTTATELFERYHVTAFRYFLRATGSRDAAEDLTQDLFLKVLRSLRTHGPDTEVYVFRIAHNLVIDYHRTHRRSHVPLADAPALASRATQVLAFSLNEALELLPETEREAFLLREVTGLSYAELAAACDTKTETVRSRLYKARCRLKALLGGRRSAEPDVRRGRDE